MFDSTDHVEGFTTSRSLGFLLRRSFKLMNQQAEQVFAGRDVTLSQWIVLRMINDGLAATPGEAARLLGHNTGATSRLVDQLEGQGLVERRVRIRTPRRGPGTRGGTPRRGGTVLARGGPAPRGSLTAATGRRRVLTPGASGHAGAPSWFGVASCSKASTTARNGCLTETGLLTQATARDAHPREWRGKPPPLV